MFCLPKTAWPPTCYPGPSRGPVRSCRPPRKAAHGAKVRGDENGSRAHGPGGFTPTALVCACNGEHDDAVCQTLREEGYEVVACPDREATLSHAINDPPDVILYSITPHCPSRIVAMSFCEPRSW